MGRRWEFRLLGPLEVLDAGRPVELRSAKQRVLLAALLMRANSPVPADELIDHLWGDQLPGAARATLQTYVMRLRQTLDDLADREIIRTWPTGYSIHVVEEQFDLARFHRLRSAARQAERGGDLAEESRLLGEALALWRGPALGQVPSQRLEQVEAGRLGEQRWEAIERRNEVELRLGRHDQLVDELRALVTEHPLRERFWAQLMLALHRGGQQAQALDVFRRASTVLAEELGIDPNAELRELHLEVLAGTNAPVNSQPGPAWLPPAVADFTGRSAEVVRLTAGLRGGGRTWTVTGPGGVGKTSLAVHVAHLVRDHFPDGQLYLNLRGTEQSPVDPATALDRLLRGLGTSGGAIPAALDERVALYRSRLADRRVLVVLDNAANEAQVRPLLPGTGTAASLVTSRAALVGLEAAHVVALDVLPPEDALRLLRAALGESRVAAEPVAAAAIATYCGHLPLALRVASARLVGRPHWQLAKLAGRLSDERRRFDELRVGDLDVRASLALSYDGLDSSHRRAFRLLASLDAPDFPAWVAGPLLDMDPDRSEDHLEALVDARLVDYAGRDALGQTRYRLHDLLRAYGREVAAEEDNSGPLRVLFEWWLDLASRADAELPHQTLRPETMPGKAFDLGDPVAWFDAEWNSIRAAVEQSAALGMDEQACGLALASAAFCDLRARFDDWEHVNQIALTRVRRHAEAALLQQRGILRVRRDRFDEAEADFGRARTLFEAAGDRWGAGYAWYGLGWMHEWRGRQDQARECHRQAMTHMVDVGNRHGEVEVLCSLGAIERRAGGFPVAQAYLSRAREFARQLGDEQGELAASLELGRLYQATGELALSTQHLRASLAAAQRMGDPDMAANIRLFLADTFVRAGSARAAEEQVRQALTFFEEHDDRVGKVWAWRLLSQLTGSPDTALRLAEQAMAITTELDLPPETARSLRQLGRALAGVGRPEEAVRCWRQAEEMFEAAGFHAEAEEIRRSHVAT